MITAVGNNSTTPYTHSLSAQTANDFLSEFIGLVVSLAFAPFLLFFGLEELVVAVAGGGINEANQAGSVCSYRSSMEEGLPYDHYLWQGRRQCPETSCAPEPPRILTSVEEIRAFENQAVRPELLRLPSGERELAVFLNEAERNHWVTRVEEGSTVRDVIQGEINSASPEQDVHLVFGFQHGVEGQTAFFNELMTEGSDQRKVNGITHLALEMTGSGVFGSSIQADLDRYLVAGDDAYIPALTVSRWPGTNIPMVSEEELNAKYEMFKIGYRECYNVVMADLPTYMQDRLRRNLGVYYAFGAREIFAAQRFQQRRNLDRRNVTFWRWGASHAEKHRLPFYIKLIDTQAKVVSIVINGGSYVDAMAFDRTLKDLGWLEKTFLLKLEGYREADYIIHVPTAGREVLWGVSRRWSPVVQHIIDALE